MPGRGAQDSVRGAGQHTDQKTLYHRPYVIWNFNRKILDNSGAATEERLPCNVHSADLTDSIPARSAGVDRMASYDRC